MNRTTVNLRLDGTHRRFDPLTGEWVLVSPGRTSRPWQGQVGDAATPARPWYDPDCYLCPGNERASGDRNPAYRGTYVFTNDFAALQPDGQAGEWADGPLLRAAGAAGTCRVLCFSPRHDLSLGELGVAGIGAVIDSWVAQAADLGTRYPWVQIFENRGAMMGASNPHPHGQVWAVSTIPTRPGIEDERQRAHHDADGRPLLADYAAYEGASGERTVAVNDDWLAVVPFWARWPFETLLLPRFPAQRLTDVARPQRVTLAEVLRALLARYDNLFHHPFPYSMGWHAAPGAGDAPHWQLHAHFNPPLLRSATVQKFMVGYEMFAEAQRDLTPEAAAARLREQPAVHHRAAGSSA